MSSNRCRSRASRAPRGSFVCASNENGGLGSVAHWAGRGGSELDGIGAAVGTGF
jgi:hypothetical protein